jgi:hypothetical protein
MRASKADVKLSCVLETWPWKRKMEETATVDGRQSSPGILDQATAGVSLLNSSGSRQLRRQ